MDEKHSEIVIIKRHGGHEEEHHGGAWKIAFADFMTAMMAFFLVLWIINATDKDTKTIIARYFNPVKLEDTAKARKGIRESVKGEVKGELGDKTTDVDAEANVKANANAQTDDSSEHNEDKSKADASSASANGATSKQGASNSKGGRQGVKPADTSEAGLAGAADPAKPKPTLSESALFKDPYASLDEIAGKPAPPSASIPQAIGRNDPISDAGTMDTDAFRDPFKPMGRAAGGGDFLADAAPSAAGMGRADDKGASLSAPAQSASDRIAAPTKAPPPAVTPSAKANQAAAPAAGAASEANNSAQSKAAASPEVAAAPPAASRDEAKTPTASAGGDGSGEVAQLRSELLKEIGGSEALQPGPGLEVQATDEGLLISLTDQFNFSMFPVGSAEPQARVVHIMEKIAQALKNRPGEIILRGYTDGRPYRSATYDNWRLSSARAQMASYMLVRGGLPEKRLARIEGYADRRLKDPGNPGAAENRRIEILLRREKS
jgi:chemotaxis protein MotB